MFAPSSEFIGKIVDPLNNTAMDVHEVGRLFVPVIARKTNHLP